jgi:hypothetical protein
MKLLMENWRKYLAEEEQPQKCVTVGSLMTTINDMQAAEKQGEDVERLKGWGWELGKKIVGWVPIVGDAVAAGMDVYDVFKKAKDEMRGGDISYDQIADYPILGHLKIDPELIKVLEDDILKQLDEMYEDQVLAKLKPDTCIDKVPSINEFIRNKIAKTTDQHVVIHDQSGTGV